MASVGIVGGGVIGLASGVALARAGHGVTLFDPGRPALEPSWANAGHIASEQVTPLSSVDYLKTFPRRLSGIGGALDLPWSAIGIWAPFALEYLKACLPGRYRQGQEALAGLLGNALRDWQDLACDIQSPGLVRADGHFIVWESPASSRRGRATWSAANIGNTSFSAATPEEARQLEALVGIQIHGAVRFSGSGQISDLDRLKSALETAFSSKGGRLARDFANLELEGGRVLINGKQFDEVIVAAGVGSARLMAPLGHHVPLIAERGYTLRAGLDPSAPGPWRADLAPIVFEDRSLIVTRYEQAVQVSSFVEFNAVDAPPDVRKWIRLERHIGELGLPVSGPFEKWFGSRPTLPDYLPAIGRSDRATNLIYAFGHQHLGLTLAAVTSRLVVALVEDDDLHLDLAPFTLDRFDRKHRQ